VPEAPDRFEIRTELARELLEVGFNSIFVVAPA
jgi:hypothetical protein